MATNEILRFAETDTGTNLLTQAEYLADSQRPIGNQPGVARSKLVNKALRQSSVIAAGVAEFLANNQSNNITDNLTPQTIANYLQAAVGNSNAATATALQTARTINGTSFNGSANITTANWGTARTLTIGNTGKSVNGSANVSWTLAEIGVTAATETASGIVELATAAEAQALASAVVALTPARLADAFKGSNQSLSSPGYQKLPGGLIIQWGGVSGFSTYTINFPIAFPFGPIAIVANNNGTTGTISATCAYVDNTKFGLHLSTTGAAYWIAIGY